MFVFSVESLDAILSIDGQEEDATSSAISSEKGYRLMKSGRFAYKKDYLHRLITDEMRKEDADFEIIM